MLYAKKFNAVIEINDEEKEKYFNDGYGIYDAEKGAYVEKTPEADKELAAENAKLKAEIEKLKKG